MVQDVQLIFCTCPDMASAERLAAILVGERLAACVSIVPGLISVYQWQGRTTRDTEVMLVIKTTTARVAELSARIEQEHPYDTPEVVCLPVVAGAEPYLEWVRTCTAENNPS